MLCISMANSQKLEYIIRIIINITLLKVGFGGIIIKRFYGDFF